MFHLAPLRELVFRIFVGLRLELEDDAIHELSGAEADASGEVAAHHQAYAPPTPVAGVE